MSSAHQRITFVHVNDQHASFAPPQPAGCSPWARQRGLFEVTRAVNPYTLFTNGGDDHEKGTVAEHMTDSGSIVADAVRAMRFDARAVGNHDFCHSLDGVVGFTQDSDSTMVLCSNIAPAAATVRTGSRWGAVRFGVRLVGQLRVGFFSLCSRPWDEMQMQPEGLNFYPDSLNCNWDFSKSARDIVAQHRSSVDLLVHLSHLGLEADCALCEAVDGIDVVLGGHSHHALSEPKTVKGPGGRPTTIIHCGAGGRFTGVLDLEVVLGGGGGGGGRDEAHHQRERHTVVGYELKRTADQAPDERTDAAIKDILKRQTPDLNTSLWTAREDGNIEAVAVFTAAALLSHRLLRRPGGSSSSSPSCDQNQQHHNHHFASAVLLDDHSANLKKGKAWAAGDELRAQTFFDLYPIEKQLAGTEGCNAFFSSAVQPAGLRVLLDAILAGPSLRDWNCLSEYYDYLKTSTEFPDFRPPKPRPWRLALADVESDGGVLVVHHASSDALKARAAELVEKLVQEQKGGSGEELVVILPKPAALNPERCGLPSAALLARTDASMEVEGWEALSNFCRKSTREGQPAGDSLRASL